MPYHSEIANPAGHESFASDTFIADRIKTYSFTANSNHEYEKAAQALVTTEANKLKASLSLDEIKNIVAIDGSLAKSSDEFPFDLSIIKLGIITQDALALKAINRKEFVESGDLESIYEALDRIALIPGRGIYDHEIGASWRDKFRKEFYLNSKHITLPFTKNPQNLLDVILHLLPKDRKVKCLSCQEEGVKTEIGFPVFSETTECITCYKPIYLTDSIFTNSLLGSSLGTAIMLTLERLLMQGILRAAHASNAVFTLEETIFVTDGPLGIFEGSATLNGYLMNDIQEMRTSPLLVGFEKGGEINRFAKSDAVQNTITPGSVAMVTSAAVSRLKNTSNSRGRQYFYGKRFIYRTKDGLKTFVFSLVPLAGEPYGSDNSDGWADSWDNYPQLKLFTDFIESHSIDRFGMEEASLDVVAEANHAASLPKHLSEKALNDLIEGQFNEG